MVSRRNNPDKKLEFEKLYLESYRLVYNYVRYRMDDASAAEDVVAEAFLLAARSFSKFDPSRAKFSTWVTKIAINCMSNHYRSLRPAETIDSVPEATFADSGMEDEVCDRDLVDRLLGVLTDEEREIVLMKYRDSKRNVDIAEELNMNASTVSTKLSNALHKMRAAAKE